jgi:hypothetical protein
VTPAVALHNDRRREPQLSEHNGCMRKPLKCDSCGRRFRAKREDWIATVVRGVIVGGLCPDCQAVTKDETKSRLVAEPQID